jgi:hypothetical protein
MKRSFLILTVGLLVALCGIGAAWAEVSKDEKNLEREEKRLNDAAAKPDGDNAVIKRLIEELKATEPQVKALRERKLDYGDIAVILALAQTMPGGVTDANVQKVLDMRQVSPAAGWGDVARMLGTKLGKIVSQVRKVANNANREIKNDHARGDKTPKSAQPEQQVQQDPPTPSTYPGEGRSLPQGNNAQ